jgi:hypothetical protein
MNGYLQRLVLSVTNISGTARTPSVRPVLGSVFATRRLPVLPEAFQKPEVFEPGALGGEKEFAPAEPRPALAPLQTHSSIPELAGAKRDSTSITQPGASLRSSPATDRPAAIEKPDLPPASKSDDAGPWREPIAKHEAADRREPLLEAEGKRAVPAMPRTVDSAQLPEAKPKGALPYRTEAVEQSEFLEAEGKRVAPYRPLVAGMRAASETTLSSSFQAFISQDKSRSKQNLSSRFELPTREPDEVQIHIGRIEVTAVPQPQSARPAAKSAHKAVNLDEYLKRGDRRSG